MNQLEFKFKNPILESKLIELRFPAINPISGRPKALGDQRLILEDLGHGDQKSNLGDQSLILADLGISRKEW